MFCRTSDPIRDAESSQDAPHIHCGECGGDIYVGDSTHDGEKRYLLDGELLCEECAHEWLEKREASCL